MRQNSFIRDAMSIARDGLRALAEGLPETEQAILSNAEQVGHVEDRLLIIGLGNLHQHPAWRVFRL